MDNCYQIDECDDELISDQNSLHSLSLVVSFLTSTVLVREILSASTLSLARIYSSSFFKNSA